jgi:glycine/D-amino acid oxidase-like deaminating enzyme
MAPIPDAVESSPVLPKHADVVIVGGGIIGASTAYFLSERGISVALCEKGEIACEQSSRNWGWCRQMGRDPRELPLIVESLKTWRTLDQRLGEPTGFRQCGILYLAHSEAEMASHEAFIEQAKPYQLDTRILSSGGVDRLMPGSARVWQGGMMTPTDGRAEPHMAAPALARAARRKGATIHTQCAVRGIETRAGRVSGVVTEKGPILCNSVVLAGGAWSRLFCGNHDVYLPQLKVLNSVMRTAPIDIGHDMTFAGGGFAARKRLDGGYTIAHNTLNVVDIVPDSFRLMAQFWPALMHEWRNLHFRMGERFVTEAMTPGRWQLDDESPFEAMRVLDPKPVDRILDQAEAELKAMFPRFRETKIVERWAGLIDTTPDAVPVIDEIEKIPGFFVATGFSGHGFGIGPGAGRLTADLVSGTRPIVDPTPFRYTRFVDGTKVGLMSGF